MSITLIFNKKPINKTHSIVDGKVYTESNAQCYEFKAVTYPIADIPAFGKMLNQLSRNMAIILGTNKNSLIEYNCTIKDKADGQTTFSRIKKDFEYSDFILFDYDVDEFTPNHLHFNNETFITTLSSVFPEIQDAAKLIKNSSSANLWLADEKLTSDTPKKHVYMQVKDPTDIERFKKVFEARLWLGGFGYTKQSKADSQLRRTIVDFSVFSPERLVFEAPPTLLNGITQKNTNHTVINGTLLDTTLLPDLTEEEELEYAKLTGRGSFITIKKDGKEEKQYIKSSVFSSTHFDLTEDICFRTREGKILTLREFKATNKGKKSEARVHSPFRWDDLVNFEHNRDPSAILSINDKGHVKLYDFASEEHHYPPECKALFKKEVVEELTNKATRAIKTKINGRKNTLAKKLIKQFHLSAIGETSSQINDLVIKQSEAINTNNFELAAQTQKRLKTLTTAQQKKYDTAQLALPDLEASCDLICLELTQLNKELTTEIETIAIRDEESALTKSKSKTRKNSRNEHGTYSDYYYITGEDKFYRYIKKHGAWQSLSNRAFRLQESLHKTDEYIEFVEAIKTLGNMRYATTNTFSNYDESEYLNLMRMDHWLELVEGDVHPAFNLLFRTLSNGNPEAERHILNLIYFKMLHPESTNIPSLNLFGVGGTGKNTLVDCILKTFFKTGVTSLDQKDLFGDFNAIAYGQIVMHVQELEQSRDLMSRIKQQIGNPTYNLTKKGKDTVTVPATAWVITSTNGSKPGILLEGSGVDRRYSLVRIEKDFNQIVQEEFGISKKEAQAYIEEVADTVFRNENEVSKWANHLLTEMDFDPDTCPTAWHGEEYDECMGANISIFGDICHGTFNENFTEITARTMHAVYKNQLEENSENAYPLSLRNFTIDVKRWLSKNNSEVRMERVMTNTQGIEVYQNVFTINDKLFGELTTADKLKGMLDD